jgi:alanyl-tRNA synthetase
MAEIASHEAATSIESPGVTVTKTIEGVPFVTRELPHVDVDRMIKTASELIKKNPNLVVIFHGVAKKTARIVVMAGKEAVRAGINATEIAAESAALLGGGGSGRPDFAQGGGTLTKNMPKALRKARKIAGNQLKQAQKKTL